jgi:diaminopimelate decarboxylase
MSPAPAGPRLSYCDPVGFTPHFRWAPVAGGSREHVFCEGVDLVRAAERFKTPTYLYSASAVDEAYRQLDSGLGSLPHTICFAVKSNGNLSILERLRKLGSGFDIVSGGELEHLALIGAAGDRIVFSGVGKGREEIRAALGYAARGRQKPVSPEAAGILLFNVESEEELELLVEEAARHVQRGGRPASAAIRVNPDVQAGGHPHISTGRHHHKFGLDWKAAKRLYLRYQGSRWLSWQGISAHIGSQIVSLAPFREAFERVAACVEELAKRGVRLRYLDLGGGLGVRYTNEKVPPRDAYARMVAGVAGPLGLQLLLEPGRSIVGPAGVLLTRVLYTKNSGGKGFVIVDAAMNDLLRPALYGAVHPITKLVRDGKGKRNPARVDIVGPVCETGDCLLRDWPLGEVKSGDVLGIWAAGAYGMSQASNYNARCRAAEVLVEGAGVRLIRRRETQSDLLNSDVLGSPRLRDRQTFAR